MSNPLLEVANNHNALPKFAAIKPTHIEPAIEQVINDAKSTVDKVLDTKQ